MSVTSRILDSIFEQKEYIAVIVVGDESKTVFSCMECPRNKESGKIRFCPATHRCDALITDKGEFAIIYNPRGILADCPYKVPKHKKMQE